MKKGKRDCELEILRLCRLLTQYKSDDCTNFIIKSIGIELSTLGEIDSKK